MAECDGNWISIALPSDHNAHTAAVRKSPEAFLLPLSSNCKAQLERNLLAGVRARFDRPDRIGFCRASILFYARQIRFSALDVLSSIGRAGRVDRRQLMAVYCGNAADRQHERRNGPVSRNQTPVAQLTVISGPETGNIWLLCGQAFNFPVPYERHFSHLGPPIVDCRSAR